MTDSQLLDRIARRVEAHGLVVSDAAVVDLATYLLALAHWNRRVNLTAIPLEPHIGDSAIDKLLVEPLLATTLLGSSARRWFDLGSGGGSPAIPLRIVWRSGQLTMVESRERKSAFLRDVCRTIGLARTSVETGRFEALNQPGGADLVTVRAVRIDSVFVGVLRRLLAPGGVLLAFGGSTPEEHFSAIGHASLPDGSILDAFRLK